MKTSSCCFIVAAPGYYCDRTVVRSSHRTFAAAARRLRHGEVVRAGTLVRGDEWLRVWETGDYGSPIVLRCSRREVRR